MIKVYLLLLSLLTTMFDKPAKEGDMPTANQNNFALVIHGGAGSISRGRFSPEEEELYKKGLSDALDAGYAVLSSGGNSVDAVETAIKILEDNPLFNAGKGGVLTSLGENELDASIMDGRTRNAGAVASVKTIKNPISAARLVMEKSPHVMLVSTGAETYARENGLEMVENIYFRVPSQWKKYQDYLEKQKQQQETEDGGNGNLDTESEWKYGTVGCVALDMQGNIVAGTSTGGMSFKRFGRVGDSPIIGAGCYANNQTCGISATGEGEYFIRGVISYDISARMEYAGESLEAAATEVIMHKLAEMGGTGGVIGLDSDGNISMIFNTSGMFRGYIDRNGNKEILLYKE